MRLLNFNIRHGGGVRRAQIADAVIGHKPDVVVLTEYRAAPELQGVLGAHGLQHQLATEPPRGANGVAVFSTSPIEALRPTPGVPSEPPGRWIEARIPAFDAILVAVYLPGATGAAGVAGKQAFWRALHAAAANYRTERALIVGDLNTGAHFRDEDGATLLCANEFCELETKYGWRDAWRLAHGDRREYTWWSLRKGGHLNRGFRLDHVFVSAELAPAIVTCDYSQAERDTKMSDHAAQILEIDLSVRLGSTRPSGTEH